MTTSRNYEDWACRHSRPPTPPRARLFQSLRAASFYVRVESLRTAFVFAGRVALGGVLGCVLEHALYLVATAET